MFILHQVHRLERDAMQPFESFARDELLPAVAVEDGSRLFWYASATDVDTRGREAITMIAMEDAAALGRFAQRATSGDLAAVGRQLQRLRNGVETRLAKPLRHNPLSFDINSLPTSAEERHPTIAYMHDFVPPRIGQRRAYEDAMVDIYCAMTDSELLDVALWAGYEPVAGPIPEQINISRIQSTEVLVNLLGDEIPRDSARRLEWMSKALKLRDRWTTRLVRCAPWSPLY
jgi:hypothetical protein